MSLVVFAVKVGAVGLQDMVDAVLKGLDKFGAAALKFHGAAGKLAFHPGEFFGGNAVRFEVFLVSDVAPNQMSCRNVQRFIQVDDGVRRYDAAFPNR